MGKVDLRPSFGTLVKEYLLITVGLTMYALGWAMFLTPNGMIGGGVTGFHQGCTGRQGIHQEHQHGG